MVMWGNEFCKTKDDQTHEPSRVTCPPSKVERSNEGEGVLILLSPNVVIPASQQRQPRGNARSKHLVEG